MEMHVPVNISFYIQFVIYKLWGTYMIENAFFVIEPPAQQSYKKKKKKKKIVFEWIHNMIPAIAWERRWNILNMNHEFIQVQGKI